MYRAFEKVFSRTLNSISRKIFLVVALGLIPFLALFFVIIVTHNSTTNALLTGRAKAFEASVDALMHAQQQQLKTELNHGSRIQRILRFAFFVEKPAIDLPETFPTCMRIYDGGFRSVGVDPDSTGFMVSALNDKDLAMTNRFDCVIFYHRDSKGLVQTAVRQIILKKEADLPSDNHYGYVTVSRLLNEALLEEWARITGSRVELAEYGTSPDAESEDLRVVRVLKNNENQPLAQIQWTRRNPYSSSYQNLMTFFYWLIFGMAIVTLAITLGFTRTNIIRPLKAITTSLQNPNFHLLQPLTSRKDEMGIIARLVMDYQQQKCQLDREVAERRKAEAQIREQEKKYHSLVDHMGEGVLILDFQGSIQFANPATTEIFGLPDHQLIGQPIRHFVTQAMYERFLAQTALSHEGFKTHFELEIIRPDHELRMLLITLTLHSDTEGQEQGHIAILRDMTERQKFQEALRRSQEAYKQIAENMLDMVSRLDVNGRLIYISPSHGPVLGYQPEEMIGRTYLEFIHPEDAERYLQALHHHIYNHRSVKLEFRFQHASGHYLWLEAVGNPVIHSDRSLIGSVFATRDISQRKTVESALQESRQMLQTVLDTIPVGVFWKTKQGVYMGCNRKFAEDNGYKNKLSIMGKTDHDLCSDEAIRQSYLDIDQQIFQSGKALLNFEEIRNAEQGEKRWSRTSKIPLCDSHGDIIGLLGVYEDITERKNAENFLKESEEKYRRLVELSPWPIAIHRAGKIVYINPAGAHMMGFDKPEDMIGLPVLSFVHPDYQSLVSGRIQTMNTSLMEAPVIEEKFIRRDGQTIDVEVAAIPFVQKGDTYFQVMLRDITQRKKMEDALRQSERRYRDLFNESLGFICIHNMEGTLMVVNPSAAHALGYEPEELIGKNMRDLLTPLFVKHFAPYLHDIQTQKYLTGIMHILNRQQQRLIWMFSNRLYEDEEHHPYVLCHAQDITELEKNRRDRERLIRELKISLQRVRTLSGLLPICAACKKIRDDKGYWNQLEHYISLHSEAEFTHGICPECQRKLYPELYDNTSENISSSS